MKKNLVLLCVVLLAISVICSACFDDGTLGLQYEYESLQTAPLVGTFSGMYIVTGLKSPTKNLVIPEKHRSYSVYVISESAFSGNTNLETVVLPTAVYKISGNAFEGCTSLKKVYYSSTQEVKDRMLQIYYGNECLENATWYFYSEEKPVSAGNFWHWENKKVVEW